MRYLSLLLVLPPCLAFSFADEAIAPLGKEMLYGKLESQKWYAEVDEETVCQKRETKGIFRFEVQKNGKESWHPLLISRTHTFEAGKAYSFSIKAKADKPTEVFVGAIRDEKDYCNLGFSAKMALYLTRLGFARFQTSGILGS